MLHIRDMFTTLPLKKFQLVRLTVGKFLVNQHPAVVLFDLGALHPFMSTTFASKHNQKVVTVDGGALSISVAGNSISTNQMVRGVTIKIGGREYSSDLIILLGLGIDVILGMK